MKTCFKSIFCIAGVILLHGNAAADTLLHSITGYTSSGAGIDEAEVYMSMADNGERNFCRDC